MSKQENDTVTELLLWFIHSTNLFYVFDSILGAEGKQANKKRLDGYPNFFWYFMGKKFLQDQLSQTPDNFICPTYMCWLSSISFGGFITSIQLLC